MKAYCRNTTVCRRSLLMSSFEASDSIKKPTPIHMCCDICSTCCTCSQSSNSLLGLESLAEFEFDEVKHDTFGATAAKPNDKIRPILVLKKLY